MLLLNKNKSQTKAQKLFKCTKIAGKIGAKKQSI